MNNQEIKTIIDNCHESGKKVAISFCSHVPQEILEAAGVCSLRVPYVNDANDAASAILIRNVCPIVKNVCNICEDDASKDADIVFAETSCDGKKKMYELLSEDRRNQNILKCRKLGQQLVKLKNKPYVRITEFCKLRRAHRRYIIAIKAN